MKAAAECKVPSGSGLTHKDTLRDLQSTLLVSSILLLMKINRKNEKFMNS